ncbi:Bloom syndrome protein homolog [Plakobranchus ocellatus]|uniref:RecQ-like DNA helicase BLM n=1 Tax=Plakobranchus ocellatus TaxID=259542 RepID=A0AAV3YDC3_9GAST|nr:Bloom syndrome protein homolog [Plakobranchus ocellatus]
MASKRTTFKGFTFTRPGSSSNALKNGTTTGNSAGAFRAAGLVPPPLPKPISTFTASRSTEVLQDPSGTNTSKKEFQTSITSFTRNKQVAVAAVLPQRASNNLQQKSALVDDHKDSFVFSETPIEILDDDDDFEAASFSQSQFKKSTNKKWISQKHAQDFNLALEEKVPVQNYVSMSAEKRAMAEPDEEIINKPKRRKTLNVIESDEDDDNEVQEQDAAYGSCGRDGAAEKSTNQPLATTAHSGFVASNRDICKHPLLSRNLSWENQCDVSALKDVLLRVVDEVCEIVCNIRTGDLMDLVSRNYERLQKLLSVRKQIKDLDLIDLDKPLKDLNSIFASASNNSINTGFKHCSTPVSVINKCETLSQRSMEIKETPRLPSPFNRNTPRFPCVNSFFETDRRSKIGSQFSKNAKINNAISEDQSIKDGSFVSGQKETRPLSVNSFSHQNSFSDLFASQDQEMEDDNTSRSEDIENKGYDDLNDSKTYAKQPCMLSQSMKEIDELDFEDEMEVAMMYDDDNGEDDLGTNLSQTNVAMAQNYTRKREESLSSRNAEYTEESDYNESFKDTEGTKNNTSESGFLEEYTAVFGAGDHDDGSSPEFAGMNFEHSGALQSMFRQVFGLKEFRHNQLPAINAALLGNDCFILMPTGGGKSLCYQLPALVTNGVSIIISPLRALIQDQTQRLLSLDIPASHLSSDVDTQQAQCIYSGLYQRNPAYKLLYVTPEKLSASEKLLSCLDSLYKRQLLTRFVIDEAHCVSHWGHDFRPDYKKLYVLRQRYPGVPMMALTATATPRVRKDIIHQLSMTSPKWFMQSFNRPNLKYTVQNKKPSTATADIIEIIKTKFGQDSGIIYCLSRKECDSVAAELQQVGIQAESYHAGLDDGSRARVQDRWLNDDNCKVICATIAFGMGIDKSDVRFVIHYSLPKSVEGYYQEAGRAGRDGVLSYCMLFYSYQDVKRLRRMLEMDQNATYESKQVHFDNLFRMIGYCENVTDCRRCQILQYFGESSFDRSMCSSMAGAVCDNCQTKSTFSLRDVTLDAKEIVKCVKQINSGSRGSYTLIHLVEIFKGSNTTKIQNLGHSKLALHGRGKDWARADVERLCRKLVIDRILKEDLVVNAQDHTLCYVKLGPRAIDLMQNKIKVELAIQGGRRRADVAKVGSEPKNSREKVEAECLIELRKLARKIAAEHNMKNYALIFPESALKQLAQHTPITKEEMIEQIDHFNATIVEKYQAHRFLEITLKYSMEIAGLEADNEEDDVGSQSNMTCDNEWASRYFEDNLFSGSTKGRGGGFKRGGKKRFFNKGKGRGFAKKAATNSQTNSTRKKKAVVNKTSLGQFQFKAKDGGKIVHQGGINSNSRKCNNVPDRKPAKVTKSTLGLMPDPRSRSFLTPSFSGGRGGYI